MNPFKDQTILVTGGTGSFGNAFVSKLCSERSTFKKLIVFSRDEYKQHVMNDNTKILYAKNERDKIRFFIGDIRDITRLKLAFKEVDIVIHAAALKHVSTGEYNSNEMVKTNVVGTQNVIEAAIDCNVDKIILLSSDKAVSPLNFYGGTKKLAEGLFMSAQVYVGAGDSKFSVVRYGNVWNSRGGVIDLWAREAPQGTIYLTKPYATRFIITLEQAVKFIIESIDKMKGNEIFIPPNLPAVNMDDVASVYKEIYHCSIELIPTRPGDKIHETLDTDYTSDQARRLTKKEIKELVQKLQVS